SAPDSPRAHLAREARKSPVRPSPAAQCTTICRPAWAWVRVCWIACSRSALRRHSKIRDGQIHHLEARLVVQRTQLTSALVETFGIAGEEDDHRNPLRTKAVVGVAMQVIGSEGHRTPEDPTRQTKGEFCQRHGSILASSRVGPCQRPHASASLCISGLYCLSALPAGLSQPASRQWSSVMSNGICAATHRGRTRCRGYTKSRTSLRLSSASLLQPKPRTPHASMNLIVL